MTIPKPYFETESGSLYQGDALEVLKQLPDETVHCCVTSPPYWGLRDYGVEEQLGLEKTPGEYVKKLVAVLREVKRVLRYDSTLWLNLGDSYAVSRSYQVSDNKNISVGPTRHLARATPPNGFKPKDLIGIPWRVAFALQSGGWYLRQDIIWAKPNPMPESVKDRCTKSHEYLFLLSKSAKYYYDHEAIREPVLADSVARANRNSYPNEQRVKAYPGQPSSRDRGQGSIKLHKAKGPQKGYQRPNKQSQNIGPMARGKEGFNHQFADPNRVWDNDFTRHKRSVWNISTKPFFGAHFAVFPPDLIKPCILAGCPVGGTVLDPFFGSGTTGIVAHKFDRKFIGIELSEKYLDEIAIPRIKEATKQLKLF